MKNKKIYILTVCLAVLLISCWLNLAKKTEKLEVKKETVLNSILTSPEKIATTTESQATSSTDDMSEWKTYSNKVIGIEFKYPSTWPTIKKEEVGDIKIEGMPFDTGLIDMSAIFHIMSNYDNLSIDEQYKNVKCSIISDKFVVECEKKISDYGIKYTWTVGKDPMFGDNYAAIVATGKYILAFSFDDKNNYDKRADEYQKLLSTLKIPE